MLGLGLRKGSGELEAFEVERPALKHPDDVRVRILAAGIDGTDKAIVRSAAPDADPKEGFLIIGHEAVGVVEEVGEGVSGFHPGDVVVPTVRRSCNLCAPCLHGHSDMCATGLYKERGIHKLHGYFTEYIVEREDYLVRVPPELVRYAVLTEPLSVIEKALQEVRQIQARFPWACDHAEHRWDGHSWASCKKALVIGAGPLGSLATLRLALEGVHTAVVINRAPDNPKVKLLKELDIHYIDSREPDAERILDEVGKVDIVVEATGASQLAIDLLPAMGRNSIYVMTGIPRGMRHVSLDGDALLRQLVRQNQVIIGSVNSNRDHFVLTLKHMQEILENFGPVLDGMITHRFPFTEWRKAFELDDPDAIKVVMEMEPLDQFAEELSAELARRDP